MEYRRFGNTLIARIDKGEEITEKVREISLKENIKLASVQALGAVGDFTAKNREEKFGYFELLSSGFDKECTKAFFRIYDRINIEKINDIIENTPFISDIRKNFYKKMISYRKELIFDKSYELLTRQKG